MNRASTFKRIERLDQLSSRLKSEQSLTVADLADDLGVSIRTVTRDIQLLRDRGLPIEADRGRGGGLRLHWRWGVGQVKLNYSEAVDLLVSLAVAEQMKSPLLMANLASVRRKLVASFSPDIRRQVNRLKSRILVGGSASSLVLSAFDPPNPRIVEDLHQAFLLNRILQVRYRAQDGEQTERAIEPHYLLLNYPIWYVLAWDHLRNDIRMFRCDRFISAIVTPAVFRQRALSQFDQAMLGINAIQP